ncbi:MAG: efflux RND transporter periplasmic adaptor subunit, partial [Burkholderiaceae bacterium]
IAEVRARVAGVVLQRTFREGSDVKKGDVLFRIDPAPFKADLDSAEAALRKAEANAFQAKLQEQRYAQLIDDQAISGQDYDNARANARQTAADVAANKAAVERAKLNLGYATVTAPIPGRIGRSLVSEGALVGQGEATQLAVIQQIDPMYVNFTQSAAEAMKLRRAMESGQFKRAGTEAASVRIVLEDGTPYARTGRLLFSDLTVDPTSGQVTLRAEVPNPGGQLLPGLYVRVQLEQAKASNAITLPQQAVTRTAQGDTVTVVGEGGKPASRSVKIGGAQGGQWVVLEGLKAGEQVIVDGFQKIRPDSPVKPVPWTPPGSRPAASAPGAAASASAAAASGAASNATK